MCRAVQYRVVSCRVVDKSVPTRAIRVPFFTLLPNADADAYAYRCCLLFCGWRRKSIGHTTESVVDHSRIGL